MSQYDFYAEYRNRTLSDAERAQLDLAVENDIKNVGLDHRNERMTDNGFVSNGVLVPFAVIATNIDIAMHRATDQFAGYPPMPEDPDLAIRFPGIDPVGKYGIIDMKFAQREQNITAALQTAPPEVAQMVSTLMDMRAQPNTPFYQMQQQMQQTAVHHRTLTRGAKLCLDSRGSKLMTQQARTMESDLSVQRYDQLLQGIEYTAGIKKGPIPQSLKNFYEAHLNGMLDEHLIERNRGQLSRPKKVDISFENFDHTLIHHQFCDPRNWGKTPAELKDVGVSVNLVENLVTPYAAATVRRSLNPLFQQAEEKGFSREGLILIDGKTVAQHVAEGRKKGMYAGTPTKEVVNQLVAGALMSGKQVETYLLGADGKFAKEPTPITKSGYEPTPVKQVVMNGWQRFFSRHGFYKELTAQKELSDQILAGRQQMVSKLNALESGAEEFGKANEMVTAQKNAGTALSDACFGDLDANPLPHTSAIRTDRTAHVSYCVARMAELGHGLKDIADPNALRDVKRAVGDQMREIAATQDVDSYTKTMANGGEILLQNMDTLCHQMDFANAESVKNHYTALTTTGAAVFDLFQEIGRAEATDALTKGTETTPPVMSAEKLEGLKEQMQSAGEFANAFSQPYTAKVNLYKMSTQSILPEKYSEKASTALGQTLGAGRSAQEMISGLAEGKSVGGRNGLLYSMLPISVATSSAVDGFTSAINRPDQLAALSSKLLSGAVNQRFSTKLDFVKTRSGEEAPMISVADNKHTVQKVKTQPQKQDKGRSMG